MREPKASSEVSELEASGVELTCAEHAWMAAAWHLVWETICKLEGERMVDLHDKRLRALREELRHRALAHGEVAKLEDGERQEIEGWVRQAWAHTR